MKSNELRIGSLVNYNIGKSYNQGIISSLVKKSAIIHGKYQSFGGTNGFQSEIKYCNIDGIPLTAVWLISLGFEDKQRGFFSIKAGSTFLRLTPPQFMGEWQTEYCWVYDDFKFTEVKYVHQLQNLYFCLTGNELKIPE